MILSQSKSLEKVTNLSQSSITLTAAFVVRSEI